MSALVTACFFGFADSAYAAVPAVLPVRHAPHLDVEVDPRVELLAAVQSQGDWEAFGTPNGAWAKPDNPYRRDLDSWFAPYKNQPAVLKLNKLLAGGDFAFDAPVEWILHYSAPPFLKQRAPLNAEIIKRGGGQENLDSLAESFRSFARVSHFQVFFDRHKDFYSQLVATYRETSPGDDALSLIESFYGEHKSAYTVDIAPAFGGSNYGSHIPEANGEHIYDTGAPLYKNGQFLYRKSWQMNLMFHEFSHSFTNPAVESVPARYAEYDSLYSGIQYKMEPQGYGEWSDVIIELMNRTNEIRLVQLYGDADTAAALEKSYIDHGFYWLPFTLDRLKEYEANRDKYPTYPQFINRMYDVMDETEPVYKNGNIVGVVAKTTVVAGK